MERFSGFADLYDQHRPSAPAELGPLLCAYADIDRPVVVDLGSGTGLSSRWAAAWAAAVVGVEPSADMRAQAEARAQAGVTYRHGTSSKTGLDDGCADIVLAVQAMHWMEPTSTLAEVARILRPGGVFATVDADWPPVAGVPGAELAWQWLHARIRVFEAMGARGLLDQYLDGNLPDDDPALDDEDLTDPHKNRAMPGGVLSWSKAEHLERIRSSGQFSFARELVLAGHTSGGGGAERFIGLLRSQGSYQTLNKLGLSDAAMGADEFEQRVCDAYAAHARPAPPLSFSWRVRLGVRAT
jgi:SAM-dependent methyltransferase